MLCTANGLTYRGAGVGGGSADRKRTNSRVSEVTAKGFYDSVPVLRIVTYSPNSLPNHASWPRTITRHPSPDPAPCVCRCRFRTSGSRLWAGRTQTGEMLEATLLYERYLAF